MIKGLMGSAGVIVDNGNTTLPYIPQNNDNPMQGMLRVRGSDLEAFTGSSWQMIVAGYATVRLDASTESLLNWVRDKQAMEASERAARQYMERRAKEFPSLQKALEAIDRAEDARDEAVRDAIANFHILDKIAGRVEDSMPMQAP